MKYLLLTLLLLVFFHVNSQDFKPGKVLPKEIAETSHPLDALAPAAILYKSGTTSFDFDDNGNWITVTDVSVRMKIYNKEGYKYALIEVPYQDGTTGTEEVTFVDAATYNLEGGKIVKTRYEEEPAVKPQARKNWKAKMITLPNVKDGSVIEYRYIVKSPHTTYLPDWYFQHSIPSNWVQYTLSIPHYFVYNRILSSYLPMEEKFDTKKVTRMYSNPNSKGGSKSTATVQMENGSVTFYENIKVYTARNVPALGDEDYVDNVKNYQSVVKHELASTEFPNSPKKEYTATWDAVAKLIYNEQGFGDELARESYFEKDVDAILAATTKRDEVINAIFDLVKNRMTWNGQYGYTAEQNLKTAYQQKTGSVAELNLMLVALLRYAGINASPVVLSTRDNGHLTFINRNQFNYVIAGIESQNGIKFLDATSKNATAGILPVRALNGSGRIIRGNQTSEEVNLMPAVTSKENTSVVAKVGTDGIVRGHVKKYYQDYSAYLYRENSTGINKDKYLDRLKAQMGPVVIKDHAVITDDISKPVIEDFTFESQVPSESSAGKIFVSPMLLYTMSQNPFQQENRSYPIDFTYPHHDKYTFSISLPQGYVVESLPQSAYYQIKDNVGGFRFNISTTKPDQVQVVVTSDINYALVDAAYYSAIKEFFASVVKKQEEKIVLKKAL